MVSAKHLGHICSVKSDIFVLSCLLLLISLAKLDELFSHSPTKRLRRLFVGSGLHMYAIACIYLVADVIGANMTQSQLCVLREGMNLDQRPNTYLQHQSVRILSLPEPVDDMDFGQGSCVLVELAHQEVKVMQIIKVPKLGDEGVAD